MTWRGAVAPALLGLGLVGWAYGIGRLEPSAIGLYGLLASSGPWFLLGLLAVLAGFLVELRETRPRAWLLMLGLAGLIVAIHTTVPIIYGGTPEYAWVYKHVGIAQALGHYERITDTTSIYQQWPALFAATAAISALGHVGPLSFAAWVPVAFELAYALVLLATFSLLVRDLRVAFLSVLLFELLVSWVGQDYLSPQAFSYLMWLGIVLIVVRWLCSTAPAHEPHGKLARLRAPLLVGLRAAPDAPEMQKALAVTLAAVLFFTLTVAHQLTPYLALAGIGALTLVDLVRPRWLWLLLAAIAGGYLASRYGLIAEQFGGLFRGGNPLQNAAGVTGAYHPGPEALTAWIVRALAACMWLLAIAAIAWRRRTLGLVVIPALLAFSPFVILVAQNYGGEAIYRVYFFSAPWCALLIASGLYELRASLLRWLAIAVVCAGALFAGVQGLYGPVKIHAFTPAELDASSWLYAHLPHGSLIVLPAENFPTLETAHYDAYKVVDMPADPLVGAAWMDEANLNQVQRWAAGFGRDSAYVVVSQGMGAYARYFGAPRGFDQLLHAIVTAPFWSVVYRNADVTIYRVDLTSARSSQSLGQRTTPRAIRSNKAAQ